MHDVTIIPNTHKHTHTHTYIHTHIHIHIKTSLSTRIRHKIHKIDVAHAPSRLAAMLRPVEPVAGRPRPASHHVSVCDCAPQFCRLKHVHMYMYAAKGVCILAVDREHIDQVTMSC
jgi:hypothetical protein